MYPSPRSPHRPSIPTARTAVHNDILLPSVLLRRRGWRHVSRHAGHHRLCVLPLGRGSVGRVAGLLCERVACPLGRGRLLLLEGSSDVCLPLGQVCARGRVVAGFGEAFFGRFDAGFELFEFGGFGAEGLLSVGGRLWLA